MIQFCSLIENMRNKFVESDYASLKRQTEPGKEVQSLRTAKATLSDIEAIRTIKRCHVYGRQNGITGEVSFVNKLFGLAVRDACTFRFFLNWKELTQRSQNFV